MSVKFKIQYFLTRASRRALLHVRFFVLQIEWLFRPLSWDSQRWAQIPAQTGLFRRICLLRVLIQTWPTRPPSVLAELLPVMKIFYLCLDITLQKLIIIIIMMMIKINKYLLLVSSAIESDKWRDFKAKFHSAIAELQHFGRVLTTPVFSITNVPFALLVHTRHKIGTVTKTREKTVFQASFAWPNRRNNILLHVA